MNEYTISFTIYQPGHREFKPIHKKFQFKSDSDLLGASDEAMTSLFTQYAAGKKEDILFRSITLDNAKEMFELLTMNGETDE